MVKKLSKKQRIAFTLLTIGFVVLATLAYLLLYKNSADPIKTFQAKVVSHQTNALDGPGVYTLDNGKTVEYSCGECAYRFEGKVLGGPSVGDIVEVKANKNYPGSDKADYYIYQSGLYIKKL